MTWSSSSSKRNEIRAGAKLHHAVNREVLRVVLRCSIAGLDGVRLDP